jgi:hypothetical protein
MALQGQQVMGERYNFRDLTGQRLADAMVFVRASNDPAGLSRWKCVCMRCKLVFFTTAIRLNAFSKRGHPACDICRKRVVAEERARRPRPAPRAAAPDDRKRDPKSTGAVPYAEKTRRLAEALQKWLESDRGGGREWHDGFETACREVEKVLDVRVLGD